MASAAARGRWFDPGGADAAGAILGFLDSIGIAVEFAPVGDSLLPGVRVSGGRLRIDPEVGEFPGDLLHEAGHLAVAEPAVRAGLDDPGDDPGDEMAAIAWSVAAAGACGISLAVLFHPHGYRGGGDALRMAFSSGGWVGVPLLACYGMTAEPHRAAAQGKAPFPHMERWLR